LYDAVELRELDLIFNEDMKSIENESDDYLKNAMIYSIKDLQKTKFIKIIQECKITKIPIIINLSIHGYNPDIPIFYNNIIYQLDEFTKDKIKETFERINPNTLKGERFYQMINHSKILKDSYNKKDVPKDIPKERVLQKARCN
jgi:hypothetical protein